MKYADKVVDYFSKLIDRHGESVEVVDWGSESSQRLRFDVIYEAGLGGVGSVLDVGCGRGDFYPYILSRNPAVDYLGVDLTPGMVSLAQKRFPHARFECRDVLVDTLPEGAFDAVVASGIFHIVLEDNIAFARKMISSLFLCARKVLVFNMLSSHASEKEPGEYYFSPEVVLNVCQSISVRTVIRHDYKINDFTVYMYK
ncbi:class I SAM-dependent methyltransferase [Desulfovibrio subterraneus]|uniref:Methyltransferase domain-containing protein n=1 Tax=Desulfovibrio subterraneus TaxID=2718620 RepID=A0A7J0BNA3_9BACT|nr:class I SAM-dependent methyltransferase [Desulfovibrio subterraneus]GFM35156.1 hypothetical protein DSM101010T_35210 [Desulfovibrio subterraneus]